MRPLWPAPMTMASYWFFGIGRRVVDPRRVLGCVQLMHTRLHMALVRTNVTLPEELLRQIDEVAGPRGRSRYVADVVAKQVRRDLQRKVFAETFGAMVGKPGWMNPDEALAFAR